MAEYDGLAKRRTNAGVFSGLFDVLARPARSFSSAAYNATDEDEETDPLKGFIRGLQGKQTNTWSDVLANQGVTGPVGAALGFVGDVALDPTTYVGVGGARGISREVANMQAMKALSGQGKEAVAREADRLMAASPTQAWVKFRGKKISPAINLPTPATTVGQAVVGKEDNRRLAARMFSKKAEMPFGLANMERVAMGGSAGDFTFHQRAIKDLFGNNLTAEEREAISYAIEKGEELSHVPLTRKTGEQVDPTNPLSRKKVQHPEGFTTLQHYKANAELNFRKWFDLEKDMGLVKEEMRNNRYVPHFFNNIEGSELLPNGKRQFKIKAGGPDKESFMFKRSSQIPLEEAAKKGMKPETDITKLLELRAAEHYRVMGRAKLLDDAVNEFGVKLTPDNLKTLTQAGYRNAAEALGQSPMSEKWDGKYLPENITKVLNKTQQVLTDGTEGSEFMKFMDGVLREWKFINTAASPGYHIRNIFTDGLMNAADGVTNGKHYKQSRRVLMDLKVNAANQMLDPSNAKMEGFTGMVNIGGKQVKTADLWKAYVGSGAKSGFITSEIQQNQGKIEKTLLGNYYNRAKTKIGDVGDTREDLFRLAHFMKALDDDLPVGKWTDADFAKATENASKRVRKYNIDYGNLSSFEKGTLTKVIPFYSFMRQNTPLQMQMLFTKPGFMSIYPKGQDLLQGVFGAQDGDGEDFIPEWIRDTAPVRLALAQNDKNTALGKIIKKLTGAKEGEPVFLPSVGGLTPLQDLMTLGSPINAARRGAETGGVSGGVTAGLTEAFQTVAGMTNPAIKAPYEIATQKNMATGGKLDWSKWLAGMTGPTRTIGSALEGEGTPGTTAARWISGIPFNVATENRQAGAMERQKDVLEKKVHNERVATPQYQALEKSLNSSGLSKRQVEDMLAGYMSKVATPGTVKHRLQMKEMERLLREKFPGATN